MDILGKQYDVLEAETGLQAISLIERNHHELSLVLLDVVLPEADGFEVLSIMNENGWIKEIPVIITSAEASPSYIDKAYDLGALECINRPFDPRTVQHRVSNIIMLFSKQKHLENMVAEQMLEKEKDGHIMTAVLSHIVEFRNGESGMHVLDIRLITSMLLRRLCAVSDRYRHMQAKIPLIANASALHDIGKIAIDEKILNKPGKLTDDEYEAMKLHSAAGADMLEKTRYYPDEEIVRIARNICRWHHERYDGKGYPDGLVGDETPIEVQVVAIADAYDALTHERVYKKAYSHETAMRMIAGGQCGAFNPLLLRCLADIGDDLQKELKNHSLGSSSKAEVRDLMHGLLQSESASNRTLALLEQERAKYQFFATMSREIHFEYTFGTDMLTLSEWGTAQLDIPEVSIYWVENDRHHDLIGEGDYLNLREEIFSAPRSDPTVVKSYRVNIHGQWRWHKIFARPIWSEREGGKILGIIGKCIDIHDGITEMDSLKQMAAVDELTGLYRRESARRKIIEILDQAKGSDKRFALMLFDLDYFKDANDRYGHMFGDRVLRAVARRVQKAVCDSGVVARVGGDEFMMFFEYEEDIVSIADRVFGDLGGRYDEFETTVSMGIALAPSNAAEYDNLFDCADRALSAAKRKGRNGYCFYDESMAGLFSVLSAI